MKYVIVDFEWNQPMPRQEPVGSMFHLDMEIIEIGAIRLDSHFEQEAEFKAFVKPVFYPILNGAVVRLTKIRPQDLEAAGTFQRVCEDFLNWCGDDCCLCTWGPDDIPALLDNMLMHGMPTPEYLMTCDLQQIYSREIMRDEKRWALDKAVDLLGLPKERAHDALNDVRNTLTICRRVDVLAYAEEYAFGYVGYGRDRLRGLIAGRAYMDLQTAEEDKELMSMSCPWCGDTLVFGEQIRQSKNVYLRYVQCREGDEFLGRFRFWRNGKGELCISRQVSDMNDVLWDEYQSALEKQDP